jgi:hypothetical protein
VSSAGGRVTSFRIRRRADVSRQMGLDHLHSGFSGVVRLDGPMTVGDALPSFWIRSRQDDWHPLHQHQIVIDWPHRFSETGEG